MARRTTQVTIGERTFVIGPMTLGTVRRVPEAFRIAETFNGKGAGMPTPEQFDAMIKVLHDGINVITPDAISLADFNTLVNDLEFVDGIKEISEAIGFMSKMRQKPASDEVGNSASSESAS